MAFAMAAALFWVFTSLEKAQAEEPTIVYVQVFSAAHLSHLASYLTYR